ncbi:DUF460 domain-containing protein [Candidatus Woesearchaeota archaeon]|nr:DUF460 domain-containing protein [Candidatus Woesearchaeota archaeon]
MTLYPQPLIIGIDPGITTAYAVLDAEGNLLKLKSSKSLNLRTLLAEITAEGKVLVIGTDVRHIPGLIEKFAARVGAKVIAPEEDMKVGFKARLTEPYKTRDDHQRDALAAAIHAFREVRPTFLKIDQTLKELGKEHLSNDIKILVLQGHNIAEAVASFKKKDKEEIRIKRRKVKIKFKRSRLLEENTYLKRQNKSLLEKATYLEKKLQTIIKKVDTISNKKMEDMLTFKNKKIEHLNQQILQYREEMKRLQQKADEATRLLIESRGKVIAKKCKTLGWEEIENKVKDQDIILVDDVNSFSEKSLQYLKDKVATIIYKKQPTKELLKQGFSFIDAKNLPMIEKEGIALIDQQALEREKKKKDILSTIVQEYQEERQATFMP